jgi:hypothetical protein
VNPDVSRGGPPRRSAAADGDFAGLPLGCGAEKRVVVRLTGDLQPRPGLPFTSDRRVIDVWIFLEEMLGQQLHKSFHRPDRVPAGQHVNRVLHRVGGDDFGTIGRGIGRVEIAFQGDR